MASRVPTDEKDIDVDNQDAFPTQKLSISHLAASWSLEISASIASTGIIIAIACLLASWNGRPISDWGFPITLNALLSTLVTLLYLFLMVTIAKCLSQLKWNYFVQDPHALQDMVIFDDACRSAWGSFMFMLRRPYCFAAFLTIAVAAIGPFVQQILQSQSVPYEKVGIGYIPIMNGSSTLVVPPTSLVEDMMSLQLETLQAVLSGLVATSAQDFLIEPDCSWNCTWEPTWTLALDSQCQNITDKLVNGTRPGPHGFPPPALPNGFRFHDFEWSRSGGSAQHFNLTGSYPSIAFKDKGYVFADIFFVAWEGPSYPAGAFECILQLTGHNFRAEKRNTIYSESSLGTPLVNNTPEAVFCSPWRHFVPLDIQLNGTNQTLPDVDCPILLHDAAKPMSLNISINTFKAFTLQVAEVLTRTGNYGVDLALAKTMVSFKTTNITLWERMNIVAKSLNRAMRTNIFSGLPVVTTDDRKDAVIFRVIWAWMTLPASLVALTFVLLLLTLLDTRQKNLPKWTDNALALIAYGGYQAIEAAMHHGADLETLEEFARGQDVQMGEDGVLIAKF